jgi:uncharacterized protein YprB with RNaseH-like and TPR domain/predicted nuclease with RNAse H fold/dephospho-CoA kinase
MLKSTFQHLKGIGAKREQDLWRSGIASWEDFEYTKNLQLSMFNGNGDTSENSIFCLSRKAFDEKRVEFFANLLPRYEYYRIALSFPLDTIFLDIETTGLSLYYDSITVVGWSIGTEYHVYVRGKDDYFLRKALSESKVIVTFNGSFFDLPFLRKEFPDLKLPAAHIDLRFLARRVGLSGGQKAIEKQLGVERPVPLLNLEGETAPLLWYRYLRGDLDSLRLLISYNHADVHGMKSIFDAAVNRLMQKLQVPRCARSIYLFARDISELRWSSVKGRAIDGGIQLPTRRRKASPTVSLKDLALGSEISRLRMVGIDLTGSERRPSGWCLLGGDCALTQRLYTDDEIMRATLDAKPTLVSIDSPLSLPRGRCSVRDDDPERQRYGITRECERILKKRGINVYPSLIQSMQSLTARGIRLAAQLRNLGIPVIESYPGAAQDIMKIPRKRASLELLRRGLAEFGIQGDFLRSPVSHDELDAITSAVVGLFFWSGQFEALGNDQEEYLIIPELKVIPTIWRERIVVGLSGSIGAGKSTAGKFLKSRGFYYGRFSQVLGDMLQARGIMPSRESLQQIGEEVNKHPGQRWLGQELVRKFPKHGNLVIDGLRFPEDHAFLVETFGPAFLHIHLNAPREVRLARYIATGGNESEFVAATSHPVEANVPKLASLAHVIMSNAHGMESFLREINQAIVCSKHPQGEALGSAPRNPSMPYVRTAASAKNCCHGVWYPRLLCKRSWLYQS